MTIDVENPGAGTLVIAGIHDGECAVQKSGDAVTVAFRWSRIGKRPETGVGSEADLDGRRFRISSVGRSSLSAGFYVAVLTPVS